MCGFDGLCGNWTLVLLGLLAVGFGILWATDFRAMVTRRYERQTAEQRMAGVLLSVVGGVFVISGAWPLIERCAP